MDAIAIVPYAPRHAQAWRSLNEAWIRAFFVLEGKDEETLRDPQGVVLAPGGRIFMAERSGEPVGCCGLAVMADSGFEVIKMAVDPAAQGLAVGRRLLAACVAEARRLGAPRLYLETNATLKPAIALYRAFGFVDLPPRPTPYARGNVWMELRLDGPASPPGG